MSDAPVLVANLGAEAPAASRAALAATRSAARLWRLLFAPGARLAAEPDEDAVHWPAALGPEPEGAAFPWLEADAACAWLVTGDARREAARLGLALAGPEPEVVARVHDKAFALETTRRLGFEPACLGGALHVFAPGDLADPDAALAAVRAAREAWPAWLRDVPATLKPRLSSSGRGRVALDEDDGAVRAGLAKLAARGGAILEPWLERRMDLSAQLHVGPDGPLLLGTLEPCPTPSGVPRGFRGTLDRRGRVTSGSDWDEPLREAAAALAVAAGEAGYAGPCGVDAFAFEGPEGPVLRIVELNARFTLGTVTLGLARRALPVARRHFDLDADERLHLHLDLDDRAADAEPAGGVLRLALGGAPGEPRPALRLARDPAALAPPGPPTA